MNLAPVLLFVYNRPWHTEQTLNALKLNVLSRESVLYIYCDGPKENATNEDVEKITEVRALVKSQNWCDEIHIIERTKNFGLANSIIRGVTQAIEKHGKVIVLEDDIVTSVGFLKYMNEALTCYQDNKEVMHISGYMYPHNKKFPNTFFFNVPLCWGWATWDRAWKQLNSNTINLWNELQDRRLMESLDKFGGNYLSRQLADNISGRLNTWFIKWHASLLLCGGYSLYPSISMVDNIGFDNSGEHKGNSRSFKNQILLQSAKVDVMSLQENEDAAKVIREFYNNLYESKKKNSAKTFLKNKLRGLHYKLFPEIKRLVDYNKDIINNNSYIGNYCKVYPKSRLINSIIGNYTYIAENSFINNTIIGKFCSVGPNLICGWGGHPLDGISTHPMFYSKKAQNGITLSEIDKVVENKRIQIGNDVYIGMNVSILDGVTIGNGAVIGAGAIVSKNIPDYAVAIGNPIKISRYRFSDDVINFFLELEWWNYTDDKLKLVETHFFDIRKFIELHNFKKC